MRKIINLLMLIMFVFFVACAKEEGKPGQSAITIGPEGGAIYSDDRLASVDFPSGALSQNTTVSFTSINIPAEDKGKIFSNLYFLKLNAGSISKPITVPKAIINEKIPTALEVKNLIVGMKKITDWQMLSDSTLNSEGNRISGNVSIQKEGKFGVLQDLFPPQVASRSPINNEAGVKIDSKVTVTFSEKIDSLTADLFFVSKENNKITGNITPAADGKSFEITFEPGELKENTNYTVMLKKGIKDLLGNELKEDETWRFCTGIRCDLIKPALVKSGTFPPEDSPYVPITSIVSVKFSEDIDIKTLTSESIILKKCNSLACEEIVSGSVSYDQDDLLNPATRKAYLTPFKPLLRETSYKVELKDTILDLAGNPFDVVSSSWLFTTDIGMDVYPPEILEVSPARGATNVNLFPQIFVSFNEILATDTINTNSHNFQLFKKDESNMPQEIPGKIKFDGQTATFVLSANLEGQTRYQVKLSNNIKDLANISFPGDEWEFTTGSIETLPPVIDVRIPGIDEDLIKIDISQVQVIFNLPVDGSTVNSADFIVKDSQGNSIPGSITSDSNKTLKYNFLQNLSYATTYMVSLTSEIKGENGEAIIADSWTFKTESSPIIDHTVPAKNDADVSGSSLIEVVFLDEISLDPATIKSPAKNFTIKNSEGADISGTVTYDDLSKKAVFVPEKILDPNVVYTARISKGIRGAGGEVLMISEAEEYSWNFKTKPALINEPVNQATDVSLETKIKAVFERDVNSETINENTFSLSSDTQKVAGSLVYDSVTRTVTFTPENLLSLKEYTARITPGIQDTEGKSIVNTDYIWKFITAEVKEPFAIKSISPDDMAKNVSLKTTVEVIFNRPFKKESITNESFYVKDVGGNKISGTITFSDDNVKAILSFQANLLANLPYSVTLTKAISDPQNNTLAVEESVEFTTGSSTAPTPTGTWVVYTTSSAQRLVSNNVNAIEADNSNNIWIGTLSGLSKFDGATFRNFNSDGDIGKGTTITSLAVEASGNVLWVGTAGKGLKKYDIISDKWTTFRYDAAVKDGIMSNTITSLAIDSQGRKWIGTVSGVNVYDDSVWSRYTSNEGLIFNIVLSIEIDSQGVVWVGTSKGLSKFEGGIWTSYVKKISDTVGVLAGDSVYAIAFKDGVTWIGTSGGISKFSENIWTSYTKVDTKLTSDVITAIAIDSKGNKWFGSDKGGVVKLTGETWTITKAGSGGLSNNNIKSIVIDKNEDIYFGTDGGGVSVLKSGIIKN